ncbi:hypothetical protein F4805DRAFT_101050 [Annulohypoxylon moriforme]|nr:hypothetical protein F4805DRAFT_101050 [Annulohypoxylon moriforme]
MTPSLASQCRRATYRHLCSHHDSIQFPEALLTAVFERYYVIIRTVARYGSSVPGPMENRRRMGKRQMTELNFGHSHPTSPLWALENLPDLTQWKWKPPLPPAALAQQGQAGDAERRGALRAILEWFAGHTDSAPNVVSDDIGDHTTHTPHVAEQPLQNTVWDSQTSPLIVVETGLDLISRDLSSDMTTFIKPNFTNFCDNFRECLVNDVFSGEAIWSILDGVQDELFILQSNTAKPLGRTVADQFMLKLLEATTSGLSNSDLNSHNNPDLSMWDNILQRISKLQLNTLRAFINVMSNIPDHLLGDMSPSILANLNTHLLNSGRERKQSSVIRQANQMAKVLRRLDFTSYPQILEHGTRYVLNHMASNRLGYSRVRFGWLQLLARLPNVDFSYLVKACSVLESGKYIESLSNKEICEMYLARHRSTIADAPTVRNMLAEETHGNDDFRFYGLFSLALWQTQQFDHVMGFCKFLEKLGRDQDIMHLLRALRNLVGNEAKPLVNIAIGGRLPLVALEILSLYEKSRASSKIFWDSEFSTKALKLLVESPYMRQIEVLRALRIKCLTRRKRIRYKMVREHQLRKIILKVTKAARAVATSPILSPRASLRLITHCIHHLRSFPKTVIPTPVLQALFHIITRDLARGEAGRTTRIRWFLALLRHHVGREKMTRVGLGLMQWRKANYRRHLEEVG